MLGDMASGFESTLSRAAKLSSKDPASKRKRVNRLAKLKQCKLEARREQWLVNQVQETKPGDKSLHAAEDVCVNDPGEVLNPDFTARGASIPVSWASLLNSSDSTERRKSPPDTQSTARLSRTQAEPDSDPLHSNSCLRINRHELHTFPGLNARVDNMDVSPKSCEDRSLKSKASKMGKGSRRCRKNDRCNFKENECLVAEQTQQNKGQDKKPEKLVPTHLQHHPYCYNLEPEDGWEASVDVLGLRAAPKKPSSGVLQLKVTPCNHQQHAGTIATPLLATKPVKKAGLQHSLLQREWMRNDALRPTMVPILRKHRGLHASTCLIDPSDNPQCPICTEDLDSTDMLFDSCPCGFSLCLFCYHKIAAENGRCPACRGVYIRDISAKPAVLLPR